MLDCKEKVIVSGKKIADVGHLLKIFSEVKETKDIMFNTKQVS